ncbi:MAG: YqiJ family protein [Armatimonadetes bacterium]|nr:YqiJ family protein [Armatimonadota bacterium]
MPWSSLLEWWNLIFALPFGVGLLLGAGFALTGLTDVGGDAGGDNAHDAGDADHDAHDAADSDHHDSVLKDILHWFGVGTGIPLTLLLPALMMAWGFAGLTVNHLLEPLLKIPLLYFPISTVAAVGAMILTGRFASFLARKLGIFDETPAPTRQDLIGCSGYAVFTITETEGVANIRSRTGDIHRIACRVQPGHPPIPAGTQLIVVGYNHDSGDFFVEAHPFAIEPAPTQQQELRENQQTQIGGQTH